MTWHSFVFVDSFVDKGDDAQLRFTGEAARGFAASRAGRNDFLPASPLPRLRLMVVPDFWIGFVAGVVLGVLLGEVVPPLIVVYLRLLRRFHVR